mmetsp:Transcript_19488/g.36433  ORF Transcript_19488/g.36433 Transcript_19488/m.36433 type:complete len:273 (+) Transcript_19488:160-978(+)|eukprot:CAMPEP_0201657384 /NCGR_PEP_ID=MMETSP0494-20130426/658_1 /ASSEMBLY_ACC=CAM_ASM_000839 /TAXON_ID=420259 /ORGANISM="Thalassiosira gravida, Strain GMp14c1" /LENGTH=272 /DNA_ID=CAMNT_0048134217 /DNA_START=78 /DNA_END=896 /DNA_ORIENTATION=-
MSDRADKKSKRRRRHRDRAEDDDGITRGSGVNYSKVSDRHVDDDRFEKHRKASITATTPSTATDAGPAAAAATTEQPKVSSQMAAVMRVMAGMEERTIAQKLADSNRPTWEQYKKDNEDKLDLVGVDKKKMEAYRKELDEQRDKLLTRGTNHRSEGKGDRKSKKKKKRKHHKRHDDGYSSDSDSTDDYSSDDGGKSRKRKKHKKRSSKHDRKKSSRRYDSDSYSSDDGRKKSSKHKRKKDKKRSKGEDDGSSSGDGYRLSAFFTKDSDDESK